MTPLELDPRDVARLLAVGRVAVGALLFVAPGRAARLWTREHDGTVTSLMAARGLGVRDVAIGVGVLVALKQGGDPSGWVRAGAAADATDTLSVLLSLGRLPVLRRTLLLASAGAAACLGWKAASELA